MAREIERKFLLQSSAWRAGIVRQRDLRQGYLSAAGGCSIRIRIAGDEATLNIKEATIGASRAEFEYRIPLEDAHELLEICCTGPIVEKTRYWVPFGNHIWEIDEFSGSNSGLVVAEVELSRDDESFTRPPWLGREVTSEQRYYNASLANHPFGEWPDSERD